MRKGGSFQHALDRHELKRKYAETNDPKRKRELEEKIRKLQPWWEAPKS